VKHKYYELFSWIRLGNTFLYLSNRSHQSKRVLQINSHLNKHDLRI